MNTPDATNRDYKISDDSMLQDSRTTLGHFTNDAPAFAALDPDFDPNLPTPFSTLWGTAIDTAASAPTDEQVVDMQTNLTQEVEAISDACRDQFQKAKYFIEKAFPNKKAVWNEFGYDNYDDARKSTDKLITFMAVFSTTAIKYSAQLVAANYPQASIDAIAPLRLTLVNAKTALEMAKNSRVGSTQSRVTLMNAVWAYRTKVAKAAKNVFANNFAQYKTYLLPASDETGFDIKGTVTDKSNGKPLVDVTVSNGTPADDTTTDSNGKYGFAKLSEGNYSFTFTLAGYKAATSAVIFEGSALTVDVALEK
jgi:hypothetical protein